MQRQVRLEIPETVTGSEMARVKSSGRGARPLGASGKITRTTGFRARCAGQKARLDVPTSWRPEFSCRCDHGINRPAPIFDHDNLPLRPWADSDTKLREAMIACSQGTASAPRSVRTRDSSPPSRTCSRTRRTRHPARKKCTASGCLPEAPNDIAGNEYEPGPPCVSPAV